MPSLLVHLAVGGLVAAALLGPQFDGRTLAVVLAAAAFPDVDTILGLWVQGGHRALLHTFLLPLVLGAVLVWDLRLRDESAIRARWGPRGTRTAGAAFAALVFAGIAPDMFTNGVNVFYPLHDQFYVIDGEALLSTKDGFVQTFVELRPPTTDAASGGAGGDDTKTVVGEAVGSTNNTHFKTGVDPAAGKESATVERTFTLVQSGRDLFLVVLGTAMTAARLRESRE
ncbi:MAG: metal-dependent hydrolase [Halobacteriaceae archaeon]